MQIIQKFHSNKNFPPEVHFLPRGSLFSCLYGRYLSVYLLEKVLRTCYTHSLSSCASLGSIKMPRRGGRVVGVEHQLLVYTGFTELSGKYSKLSPKQKNFLRRSTFYGDIRMVSKAFATHFLMIKW